MNHTPGPWEAWESDGFWIVSSKTEDHPDWMEKVGGTRNVAESIARPANARLIATAPDLLRECESLLSFVIDLLRRDLKMPKGDVENHAKVICARTAIAKATQGEQP